MGYLYKHIRSDKNEVFYIGIGGFSKSEKEFSYKRAYCKYKRNKIWKRITSKTSYIVEIVSDNISFEEACVKEKEYIKLYGRIDTKTGILSNLTDGGEGTIGLILSRESIERGSKKRIGLKVSEEVKEILKLANKINSKPVIQYDIENNFINEFQSLNEVYRKTGIPVSNISNACNGKLKQVNGYIWRFKGDEIKVNINKKVCSQQRRVMQMDIYENDIIIYNSILDAAEKTGIPRKSISNCCFFNINKEKDYSSSYKYKWKFIDKVYYI